MQNETYLEINLLFKSQRTASRYDSTLHFHVDQEIDIGLQRLYLRTRCGAGYMTDTGNGDAVLLTIIGHIKAPTLDTDSLKDIIKFFMHRSRRATPSEIDVWMSNPNLTAMMAWTADNNEVVRYSTITEDFFLGLQYAVEDRALFQNPNDYLTSIVKRTLVGYTPHNKIEYLPINPYPMENSYL